MSDQYDSYVVLHFMDMRSLMPDKVHSMIETSSLLQCPLSLTLAVYFIVRHLLFRLKIVVAKEDTKQYFRRVLLDCTVYLSFR